ncbi:hypothetical protein HO173_005123 [Letharia columbiana]|uniref:Protein kinase domain-containing protein n=1 Tax=Letharia columbiana TaxID=112416 RepID=A0A8H6FY17_9LECA|nr:uncharacterized protein HO173_005123 [Letharia columbiana]KAF6236832.1 hypothetical protein HO173_005123 [Letharia columbiana]
MDPASFSFAVVGMFFTCAKGYKIFSDAYKAPADAQKAARDVLIEGCTLEVWGEHFEIHQAKDQRSEKLKIHLLRGPMLYGCFEALCAISEIFTDIKGLDRKYGICFNYHSKGDRSPHIPRNVRALLEGRDPSRSPSPAERNEKNGEMDRKVHDYNNKMSLLQKCRWSLKGKGHVETLLKDLRKYNDDLVRLCTWEAQAQINRGLPTFALPQCKNFLDLHFMADSAQDAAKDKSSPMADGRERIAEMARFKAKVVTPAQVSKRFRARWRLLDKRDYVVKTSGPRTLAISRQDQQIVFVEWQSYIGHAGRPNKLAEEQIQQLGDFLSVPDRPHDFRILDCIGLFKDEPNSRYGVVYHLPSYMRDLARRTRPENLGHVCKPSSLTHLLDNVDAILDLGFRFDLAKKLVYSIVVLHTCGWLHKNIRSNNIFFFPARPADNKSFENRRKDLGRPYIMGYGLSRPDDVVQSNEHDDRGPQHYSRSPEVQRSGGFISRRVEVGKTADHDKLLVRPSRSHEWGSDADEKPQLNIYQHPDKMANPARRFRHSYDIYSLGLVLLEIGLWQSLQTFENGQWDDAYAFRHFVLTKLVPDLWGQCGSIYGGVVKDCLKMSSDIGLEDEEGRRLAWSIAERLNLCNA